MDDIRYFTILGERCSGTHFLQHAILQNFHFSYMKGEKHFFGNREFRDLLSNVASAKILSLHEKQMCAIDLIPPNELLTICIVRDPVEWIDSFFKRKHHVPPENRESIDRFLSSEFYSIYEEPPKKGDEIMEDRNWQTKERYRDLFELRRMKCQYLCDTAKHTIGRYFFLRYEDLRDHYEKTLETIQTLFQLRRKSTGEFIQTPKYKGTYHALYEKKPVMLTDAVQSYIWGNLDVEQESRMGYVPTFSVETNFHTRLRLS